MAQLEPSVSKYILEHRTASRGNGYAFRVALADWRPNPHHSSAGFLYPPPLTMASSRKKRKREAWNRFGDVGRGALVATATLMPRRSGAEPARVSAGACLIAIKFIVKALKLAVPERRPDGEDNKSFPSEHAAQCVAAAMIIEREYPGKVGALAYGLAAVVSMSRIEGKKHHPRDVIAGALIGCAAVFASLKLRLALEGASRPTAS